MIKKLITRNLGTIQFLLTYLIVVGMVVAGYYLVPGILEQHEAMRQLDIELRAGGSTGVNGLAFALPIAPLTLITMAGSGLIALIWQFRIAGKED